MWQPARPAGEYRRTLQGTRVPRGTARRDVTPRSGGRRRHVVGAPQDGCARERARLRGGAARGRPGVRRSGPAASPDALRDGPVGARNRPREGDRDRAGARKPPSAARIRAPNRGFRKPVSGTRGGPENTEAPAGGGRAPGWGERAAQPWSIPTKWPSSASISGAESSSGAVGRTTSSGGLAASSASTSAQVRCSCGTQDSRWRL